MAFSVPKPKMGGGMPKTPASAKFGLGSRPASLRDTGLARVKPTKPAAVPNTRDYSTKGSPATALQPGNPMPPIGGQGGI
jgi:hypothetical protein